MINNKSDILDIFPVLQTVRLNLIEIKQNQLGGLFKIFGNDSVTEFYNMETLEEEKDAQKLIDRLQERFNDKLGIRWGISLKGESKIIGTIGFNNFRKGHRANIGYDLQKDYWNNGYITESLNAVIKFGFEELEINRIEAEVVSGNYISEKVLDKLNSNS